MAFEAARIPDQDEARARAIRLGKPVVNRSVVFLTPRPPKPVPKPVLVPSDNPHIYAKPIGPLPAIYDRPIGPPELWNSMERARFIVASMARNNGYSSDELISHQRNANLTKLRHEAIYLVSKCTTWSWVQIGKFFGGRDHSSVLHAVRRHKQRIGVLPGAAVEKERKKTKFFIKSQSDFANHDINEAGRNDAANIETALTKFDRTRIKNG